MRKHNAIIKSVNRLNYIVDIYLHHKKTFDYPGIYIAAVIATNLKVCTMPLQLHNTYMILHIAKTEYRNIEGWKIIEGWSYRMVRLTSTVCD